jgi:hypothetical protein
LSDRNEIVHDFSDRDNTFKEHFRLVLLLSKAVVQDLDSDSALVGARIQTRWTPAVLP